MTKGNNTQIKKVSNSKKQAPWGNLFGRILKAICIKYLKDKAVNLSNDFKEFYEKEEGKPYYLNKIDPLTLICYLTDGINKGNNRITKFIKFLSECDINFDKKLDFNNETGIHTINLFEMINKCKDNYPVDKLWKLSLKINKGRFKGNKIKDIFDKITQERSGVKITNLSAIMYVCKPNKYYCIDQKSAKYMLERKIRNMTDNKKKEINDILNNIKDNKKGSYSLVVFKKLQYICKKNKNIIGTPYEFYLNSH